MLAASGPCHDHQRGPFPAQCAAHLSGCRACGGAPAQDGQIGSGGAGVGDTDLDVFGRHADDGKYLRSSLHHRYSIPVTSPAKPFLAVDALYVIVTARGFCAPQARAASGPLISTCPGSVMKRRWTLPISSFTSS